MNNLLSYCGLVDVRINASDKDLPVIRLGGHLLITFTFRVTFLGQQNAYFS